MTSVLLMMFAVGVLESQAVAVQQPRDARPPTSRSGTAAIRGRVYSADTALPLRGAVVMLMPVAPPPPPPPPAVGAQGGVIGSVMGGTATPPRRVAADGSGSFEFTGLPAGSYRLRVMPGPHHSQYLATAFGAKDSFDQGRVIELKEGESFDQANCQLRRGGAIAGRIVDDAGQPLTRINVFPSRMRPGANLFDRTGGGFQSDDHGRYRIYGLEAGEYIIAAEGRGMGGGPPVEGVETEGFVTTYHPSTLQEREAGRLRVRAGADVDGADIQLVRTRTFRITGTIMDSKGQLITRPWVQLTKRVSSSGFSSSGASSIDQHGRFTMRDVVPGEYTLVVRPQPGNEMPGPAGAQQQSFEMAMLPLNVVADIENLVVVTQPGVSIAGEVVFSDGEPPATGPLRVMAEPSRQTMSFGPPPSATVGADRRFTLNNLFGPTMLRVMLRREWALKAVMLGATDITETPVEFKTEHSGHLKIIVTTRAAMIEGTVTGDDGAPVDQAMVMVFPEDKESWRFGSPRIRTAMSTRDGKFTATGLIGGRYYAVATPFRSLGYGPDVPPEFFEALTRDATRVVVSDDERRVVDLRISKRE